jgi:hypothetical protein
MRFWLFYALGCNLWFGIMKLTPVNAQGRKRRRAASSDDKDDGDQDDGDGRPAKRRQKGPIFNVYFNGLKVRTASATGRDIAQTD